MELPVVFVLLVFGLSSVSSHPKNSDVLPKEYYKRQILQPIPGYIPVYIQTDDVPIVRKEKVKHNIDVPPSKPVELREKSQLKNEDKVIGKNEKIKNESALKDITSVDKPEAPVKVEVPKTKGKYEKVKSSQVAGSH